MARRGTRATRPFDRVACMPLPDESSLFSLLRGPFPFSPMRAPHLPSLQPFARCRRTQPYGSTHELPRRPCVRRRRRALCDPIEGRAIRRDLRDGQSTKASRCRFTTKRLALPLLHPPLLSPCPILSSRGADRCDRCALRQPTSSRSLPRPALPRRILRRQMRLDFGCFPRCPSATPWQPPHDPSAPRLARPWRLLCHVRPTPAPSSFGRPPHPTFLSVSPLAPPPPRARVSSDVERHPPLRLPASPLRRDGVGPRALRAPPTLLSSLRRPPLHFAPLFFLPSPFFLLLYPSARACDRQSDVRLLRISPPLPL